MPRKRGLLSLLLNYIARHEIPVPQRFIETTKTTLLRGFVPDNDITLDDFDAVIDFVDLFPSAMSEDEFEEVRQDFSRAYIDMVDAEMSALRDSETIRQYASQLKAIGERLNVEVETSCDQILEVADEIDANSYEQDYENCDSREAGNAEMRSDEQIHSMFDTLR